MSFHTAKVQIVMMFASAALAITAHAQTPNVNRMADSVRMAIEAAAEIGDVPRLDDAIALTDRALVAVPNALILMHYRAYALYRAAGLAMGHSNTAAARQYLEHARPILESLVKAQTIPESHALLSAVYGLQIAVSRVPAIAGMRLGPKATDAMKHAIALAPHNPRVLVLQGIGDFNTPSAFGGGLDKAEKSLLEAIALFPTDNPALPLPTWGLADAHIWLGQVYLKQKKREAAMAEFEMALALQPRNAWLLHVLMPAVERKKPE